MNQGHLVRKAVISSLVVRFDAGLEDKYKLCKVHMINAQSAHQLGGQCGHR